MDGLLDRTSPRRGSLNSLHRQSSGSISSAHNHPKLATLSQTTTGISSSSSSSSSTSNPDIDKYTRYFIIKAVQIIVQSRVGASKELRTECKPNGNDWFNINLSDVPEVSERTKAAIGTDGVSMKSNWRICCEISLKTGDGTRMVLEQWIITNRAIAITAHPNGVAGSPNPGVSLSSNIGNKTITQSSHSNLNNTNQLSNSNSTQQHSSTNAPSSIYTIYNRMTLLLKTLMTTTHIVPVYRIASKISQPNVLCYRVYTVGPATNFSDPSSPIKGVNDTSNGSSTRLDGIQSDLDNHFGPLLKIGSIRTETNELIINYRTDTDSSEHLLGSPRARSKRRNDWNHAQIGGMMHDEDYLIAAKQLLAGNGHSTDKDQRPNSSDNLHLIDQPIIPAFANCAQSTPPKVTNPDNNNDNETNNQNDLYGELIESVFDGLLIQKKDGDSENLNRNTDSFGTNQMNTNNMNCFERSENIQVPKSRSNHRVRRGSKTQHLCRDDHSSGSTPKSLSDSFVFVDINPPFASEEQSDINSFFHGPSPSFSQGFDSLKDVDELTSQLASIEANASQIDDFVDNICASEGEDEDERYMSR